MFRYFTAGPLASPERPSLTKANIIDMFNLLVKRSFVWPNCQMLKVITFSGNKKKWALQPCTAFHLTDHNVSFKNEEIAQKLW